MPRYLVIIGGRELVIDAPSLNAAMQTAMGEYPGETVTGFAELAEQDEAQEGNGEDE